MDSVNIGEGEVIEENPQHPLNNMDENDSLDLLQQKIQPLIYKYKWFILFLILSTISVLYLGFCYIKSFTFVTSSLFLIFSTILLWILSGRTLKILKMRSLVQNKKKYALISVYIASFLIGCISSGYLINASMFEWCGYVVTFNGSADDYSIHNKLVNLNQNTYNCNNRDSVINKAFEIAYSLCYNPNNCNKDQLKIISFNKIVSAAAINMIIFYFLALFGTVYSISQMRRIYFKHTIDHPPSIQLPPQYVQNPQYYQQNITHTIPIYQAEIQYVPAYQYQDNNHVIIGQPINSADLQNFKTNQEVPQS